MNLLDPYLAVGIFVFCAACGFSAYGEHKGWW